MIFTKTNKIQMKLILKMIMKNLMGVSNIKKKLINNKSLIIIKMKNMFQEKIRKVRLNKIFRSLVVIVQILVNKINNFNK
jgi:hypothetical protein